MSRQALYGIISSIGVYVVLVAGLWFLPSRAEHTEIAAVAIPENLGPLSAEQRFVVRRAMSYGVPSVVALEMAYEETRTNLNPRVRGRHGEWGRFQIRPLIHCPRHNLARYGDNVDCYLRLMTAHRLTCGAWSCAIQMYNGRGPMARAYRDRVLARIGGRYLDS